MCWEIDWKCSPGAVRVNCVVGANRRIETNSNSRTFSALQLLAERLLAIAVSRINNALDRLRLAVNVKVLAQHHSYPLRSECRALAIKVVGLRIVETFGGADRACGTRQFWAPPMLAQ